MGPKESVTAKNAAAYPFAVDPNRQIILIDDFEFAVETVAVWKPTTVLRFCIMSSCCRGASCSKKLAIC